MFSRFVFNWPSTACFVSSVIEKDFSPHLLIFIGEKSEFISFGRLLNLTFYDNIVFWHSQFDITVRFDHGRNRLIEQAWNINLKLTLKLIRLQPVWLHRLQILTEIGFDEAVLCASKTTR